VAAASITKQTNAVAVVVSESSVVRVFDDGELISQIIPELWMFSRYGSHPVRLRDNPDEEITVVTDPE